MRVVFVTCGPGGAEPLLRRLLEERLVGCGNILPGARSLYWWEGAIQEDTEEVLLMETTAARVAEVVARVKALHAYDTPKVLALDVAEVEPRYRGWLEAAVRPAGHQ